MQTVSNIAQVQKTSLLTLRKAVKLAIEDEAPIVLWNVDWESYSDFIAEMTDKLNNPLFYQEKSSSEMRESVFAAFGVAEIWRFDGEKVTVLQLTNGSYQPTAASLHLPQISPEILTEFIGTSENLSRLEWLESIRNWAQSVK